MKVLLSEVPDKLTKLLNEQLRCIEQLLELSKKQREAIKSDDSEVITKILFRKARLIKELTNIKEIYEKEYEKSSSKLTGSPRIKNLLKEVKSLLEELRKVEGESEEVLSRKCNEIKDEISQTKKSIAIVQKFSTKSKDIPKSSGLIDERA